MQQYLYHQNNQGGFDFVFGPGTSAETSVMAVVAGVQEIPIIGYFSTSPSLADKNAYPTLTRADPADDSIAIAQAEFFKQYNYTTVALLFVNDAFGVGFKDSLFAECTKRGVLLHFIGFTVDDESSIESSLKALAQLKLNIISFISYKTQFNVVSKYADKYGVSGKGKLWLFQTFESNEELALSTATDEVYRKFMFGAIKVNPTILDDGGEDNVPYRKLIQNWSSFEKYREKFNQFMPTLNGYDQIDLTFPANYFASTSANVIQRHAFQFDAIISMGLAYCKANATGKANGKTIFNEILKLDYVGLSGRVKFLKNGNRDPATITFLMENLRPDSSNPNGPFKRKYSGSWTQESGWIVDSDIQYSTGTNTPPAIIDIPTHQQNLIPLSAKQFGYALVAITWIFCIISAIWLGINRNEKLIKNSQPVFLFLLIVGVALSNVAILALMVDEGGLNAMSLNTACMVFPWFFTIGFMLGFFALFAKTYRILLLFSNARLKRRFISAKPVLLAIILVLLAESVILIAWTVDAPLVWVRTVTYADSFNNPIESHAACVASKSNTNIYVGLLVAFHAIALSFGAYVSTSAKDIPQEFQESKWIAMAMGSTLQIFLIGIPTVIATYTTSSFARYMSMMLIVFVTNFAMLLFIFIPKMFSAYAIFQESKNSSASGNNSHPSGKSGRYGESVPVPNSSAVVSGNLM